MNRLETSYFPPPYFDGGHWHVPASDEVIEGMTTNFADPDSYPVDNRAVTYSIAFFSAKHLGAGQFYLMALKDGKGNKLDGGTTYRLHVPASAPVHQYWSATVYDGKTHALIRNTPWSSRASTSAGPHRERRRLGRHLFRSRGTGRRIVELGTDQGLQHFRGDLPVLRTDQALFDKTWKLPDIEKAH